MNISEFQLLCTRNETNVWLSSIPASFITSKTTELVSLFKRLEPAAFGWTAEMSPDRPIPWINLERAKNVGQGRKEYII